MNSLPGGGPTPSGISQWCQGLGGRPFLTLAMTSAPAPDLGALGHSFLTPSGRPPSVKAPHRQHQMKPRQ